MYTRLFERNCKLGIWKQKDNNTIVITKQCRRDGVDNVRSTPVFVSFYCPPRIRLVSNIYICPTLDPTFKQTPKLSSLHHESSVHRPSSYGMCPVLRCSFEMNSVFSLTLNILSSDISRRSTPYPSTQQDVL
jgi:hypothetical protein